MPDGDSGDGRQYPQGLSCFQQLQLNASTFRSDSFSRLIRQHSFSLASENLSETINLGDISVQVYDPGYTEYRDLEG